MWTEVWRPQLNVAPQVDGINQKSIESTAYSKSYMNLETF